MNGSATTDEASSRPLCKCHGEPMWKAGKSRKTGSPYWQCRVTARGRHNAWYELNREEVSAKNKAYRAANRDRLIAYNRAWYERNRLDQLAKKREKAAERTAKRRAEGLCIVCGHPNPSLSNCDYCTSMKALWDLMNR